MMIALSFGGGKTMVTGDASDLMSGAIFDDERRYRYSLWRYWHYQAARNQVARAVMFLLGNPSTAGAHRDDPTVLKCAQLARRWGYDGMYVGNLLAIIATHYRPWSMTEAEAIGADNDRWLMTMYNSSEICVAAWGYVGGYHTDRVTEVRKMLPTLYHLGLGKNGQPKHPLYLSNTVQPLSWNLERTNLGLGE